MTALLPQDHLRQVARVMDHPSLPPGRLILALCWSVDAETGRPVARWTLSEPADRH